MQVLAEQEACTNDVVINCLLTLLGWLPGQIHVSRLRMPTCTAASALAAALRLAPEQAMLCRLSTSLSPQISGQASISPWSHEPLESADVVLHLLLRTTALTC